MKKVLSIFLFLFTNLYAEDFQLEKIIDGFERPWSLSFIDRQNLLVTEKPGNIKLINLKEKKINLIDESYNSNPLSLKFALNKLNNLNAYSKRKLILLGDMLELGKHSKKFHRKAAEFINHTEIDKVYVYGKDVIETFNKIRPQKRGKILNSKEDILNFMIKDIKNGEYLMIKGSNSTGLNRISQNLKKGKLNAF